MRFVSTRGGAEPVTFSVAMERGLAPDGGLYVPQEWPRIDTEGLGSDARLTRIAHAVLRPFLEGDPLQPQLGEIVEEALSFPLPLVHLDGFSALELFHGPTAAFKDVGARFMARALGRRTGPPRTILVATSGDTGSAVASAFHGVPHIRVVILFPRDGVSPRQKHQLTCFGDNVEAYAVRGTFDDCQRVLKEAMNDAQLSVRLNLTTANSINIARLLPQMSYYAAVSLWDRPRQGSPPIVIPSGNLGNALAALWAQRVGFPLGPLVMASNANRTVPDFFTTGSWRPRPSIRTLANAMDVGDPSNMERMFHLYPDHDSLRSDVRAVSVDDGEIEDVIRSEARHGRIWDPHTATAIHAGRVLALSSAVVVATAHPAKFDHVVEPLIEANVALPPALAALLDRPSSYREIEPRVEALEAVIA